MVACYVGQDHVALKFRKYEMTLREYINDYRDPLMLGEIFVNIINGVKELHEMGYIHRDLKPDNVVLSQRPLRVLVIDFNRATSTSIMTKGSVRGTPGYFPMREEWRNGSDKWDTWALAAMILEADMNKEEYFRCFSEIDTKNRARKHLEREGVSKKLKQLIDLVILEPTKDVKITIEQMMILVKRLKFKTWGYDKETKE